MTNKHTLILSALLAALGPLVGNAVWAGHGTDGDEILVAARDGLPTAAYVALTLELVGFAALAVLIAWLAAFLAPRTPVAAVTTAVAGTAMLAVKLGSAGPVMVVSAMPEELDARTAALLVSLNSQAFVVSGFLLCLAFLSAGVGLLESDMPRWLAWWAVVAGAAGTLAGIGGILRPDSYVPIPFLLCLLWMLAAAVTTAFRPGEASVIAESPVPAGAPATQ